MNSQLDSLNHWSSRYAAVARRLKQPLWWFPYPCLLVFGLQLILTAHILFSTNPRLGHHAEVVRFPSAPSRDSSIWLSVTAGDKSTIVTTNDRRVFKWSESLRSSDDLKDFAFYLRRRMVEEIQTASLVQRSLRSQTRVVIAADQSLKYSHIKPIIHALAQAGISNYAFETLNPVVASSGDHHIHGATR
ncbi:MAG: hypothetical protein RL011_1085 [Pseudomonadota bacterium]|jgi:biopolymer transport protein ExbD